MTRTTTIALVLMLLAFQDSQAGLYINQGGNSDLIIAQSGREAAIKDGAVLQIDLKKSPFSIRSTARQYYLCLAKTSAEIDKTVKTGSNTKSDFNSCFFMWKLYASTPDADYVVLSDGGSNSMNESHGLKPQTDGGYKIVVKRFSDARSKQDIPIEQVNGQLYGAFWVDKNGDAVIDDYELKRIQINFE